MEQVLDTYEKPYNPDYPVVNLDESPKSLHEHVYRPFMASDGTVYEDYEYVRKGSVTMFMVAQPLAGFRKVFVEDNHTAVTYAKIVAHIVEQLYPTAKQITLVEDNLSAHKLAALYELYEPARARAIIKKIKTVRTPKHGSWLNIAENEFSVLVRHGLKSRVATKEQLQRQADAWCSRRNKECRKVNWQFTTADARVKLKRLYPQFQP